MIGPIIGLSICGLMLAYVIGGSIWVYHHPPWWDRVARARQEGRR